MRGGLQRGDDREAHKATALVDLENNWVYAFRFEIKTNTSTTVGHYLLPDLTKA